MRTSYKPFEQNIVFTPFPVKPDDKLKFPGRAKYLYVSCQIGADGPDWTLCADADTPAMLRELADHLEQDYSLKASMPIEPIQTEA